MIYLYFIKVQYNEVLFFVILLDCAFYREVAVVNRIINYFFDEEEKEELLFLYVRMAILYFIDVIILIFILFCGDI